ncbi:MAG TPA: hypothetical protein VK427_20230 [Kofleriaceae bacterium]|nr:hypothetical protein [Kofleriaceae bacterium]
MSRDAASKLAELVERCAGDAAALARTRAEGDALAIVAGVEVALAWRVAVLRALMANPSDDDAVRELYGELCDRYRDDPEAQKTLRPLGAEIRRLEAEGTLPSTLVARSDRRRRS